MKTTFELTREQMIILDCFPKKDKDQLICEIRETLEYTNDELLRNEMCDLLLLLAVMTKEEFFKVREVSRLYE